MKKIVSFVLVLALAFSLSPAAFAAVSESGATPYSYLWLDNTGGTSPALTFTIPAAKIPSSGALTLKARVFFDSGIVVGGKGGLAYINCYSYSDEANAGKFEYLINYVDFAGSSATFADTGLSVKGRWVDFEVEFDPHEPAYANGREDTQVVIRDGRATSRAISIGFGFYLATGRFSVASASVSNGDKVIWKADFSDGFDPASPDPSLNLTSSSGFEAANKGVCWDIVKGAPRPDQPLERRGDFNSDGQVNSDDAVHLLRHVLFSDVYSVAGDGDVNCDGSVSSDDAVLTLRCVLFPESYCYLEKPERVSEGKKYVAKAPEYRTDSYGDANESYGIGLRYKLTDGVSASTGNSGNIAGYYAGTSGYPNEISVVIDLEHSCRLAELSIDLFGGEWGVPDPKTVTVEFSISENGADFTKIGSVKPKSSQVENKNGWKYALCTVKGGLKTARYVRAVVKTSGYAWCSEFTVTGYATSSEGDASDIARIYIDTADNSSIVKAEYRPCTITVYDPTGKYSTITDPNGTVKVRGNSTSGGAKQPYNIKFDKKQNVFGFGKCKKWCLLANMYDKTQIRNTLAYNLANDIGMAYVQQSAFVELYVNGTYCGVYQLCESVGVGDTRVDIDVDGNEFLFEFLPYAEYSTDENFRTPKYNILLGINDPESPTEAQRAYMQEFFTAMENAIESKNYDNIIKYVDVPSFIDSFIVHEFFKEVDYATSSTRFYLKEGKLYAGPVWDFDLSSGNCSSSYYTGYNNVSTTGLSWQGDYCYGIWNKRLFKCTRIMDMVKARYKELQPYIVNVYKDNELGKNKIDELLEKNGVDIRRNYTRWYTEVVYSTLEKVPEDGTYESEIAYLRDWLEKRNAWLKERFGID